MTRDVSHIQGNAICALSFTSVTQSVSARWVTSMGMQLHEGQLSGFCAFFIDSLDWVHWLQAWKSEQAEACNTEKGVENINHIARPVGKTTHVRVLLRSADRIQMRTIAYLTL